MCVYLALAACSPKQFSVERVARCSYVSDAADSSALRRWLEREVRESLKQQVETVTSFELETVQETLSSPDSSGGQHVTSRSTTRTRGSSVSTAGSHSVREEVARSETDSSSVSSSHGEALTEEKERIAGRVSGWMPWYVYVTGLVGALLIGLVLAIRGKKWSKMKL
ncbi:MAG: hypothetical protein IJK29_05625 [Bacteroidales bacterium]|nr:hypothetical protein [Bacteroidales bacterium]MBR0052313.1 hypothetical protein [Bacteroidales bacterium]